MAILEGRWDCASCGRTGNMGHDLHCAGCGKPRGAVEFYLPPNAEEVREAEKLAEAKAGPDWVCGYCEASNRSTSAHCTGCGAERADGKARAVGGGDETELTDEQRREREVAAHYQKVHAENAAKAAAGRTRALGIGCAVLLFLGCAGFFPIAFMTRMGGAHGAGGPTFRFGSPSSGAWVTVVDKKATRSIEVEAERLVQDSGWCSSEPGDARELSRHSKQDGTRCQWLDPAKRTVPLAAVGGFFGTKNLGNGYFESTPDHSSSSSHSGGSNSSSCRNIPVYRDWCTWEAMRWTVVRTPTNVSASGVPAWPTTGLQAGEREGTRREQWIYSLQTSDGERIPEVTTDPDTWSRLETGRRYSATFSMFGGFKALGAAVP